MATTASLPSSSLSKISRWYNAKKASGQTIQPWELEAAYRGELNNLSNQQATNRGLTLQSERDKETERMNTLNSDRQDAALRLQAQMAGAAENRALRQEERQARIDEFEKKKYDETTATQKEQYNRDLEERANDRSSLKNTSLTTALGSIGTLGAMSLLKDSKPSTWFDNVGDKNKPISYASPGDVDTYDSKSNIGQNISPNIVDGTATSSLDSYYGNVPQSLTDWDYASMPNYYGDIPQSLTDWNYTADLGNLADTSNFDYSSMLDMGSDDISLATDLASNTGWWDSFASLFA